MNNTNSSPFNDWMILLGVLILVGFVAYFLIKTGFKIASFLIRYRYSPVRIVDMTNVIPLKKRNHY